MKITIDKIIREFFYLELLINREDIPFIKKASGALIIEDKKDAIKLIQKYRDCLKETTKGQIVISYFIYDKSTMIHIEKDRLYINWSSLFTAKERDQLSKDLKLNYE